MKSIEKCTNYSELINSIDEAIAYWREKIAEEESNGYSSAISAKEWLQYWKGMKEGAEAIKAILKINPYAIHF